VRELEAAIETIIETRNRNPRPYVWTASAAIERPTQSDANSDSVLEYCICLPVKAVLPRRRRSSM